MATPRYDDGSQSFTECHVEVQFYVFHVSPASQNRNKEGNPRNFSIWGITQKQNGSPQWGMMKPPSHLPEGLRYGGWIGGLQGPIPLIEYDSAPFLNSWAALVEIRTLKKVADSLCEWAAERWLYHKRKGWRKKLWEILSFKVNGAWRTGKGKAVKIKKKHLWRHRDQQEKEFPKIPLQMQQN